MDREREYVNALEEKVDILTEHVLKLTDRNALLDMRLDELDKSLDEIEDVTFFLSLAVGALVLLEIAQVLL